MTGEKGNGAGDKGHGSGGDARCIPCEPIGDAQLEELLAAAHDVKTRAYAPYSKFRVGASLLTEGGRLFTGANVENVSYGLAICAERNAMFQAVSAGHRRFRAIVVTSDVLGSFTAPCGACRQVMAEFGDFHVFLLQPDGTRMRTSVGELLPLSFDRDQLSNGSGATA